MDSLWGGADQDLALPPITPGTYTGPLSFKVSGQDWITTPAARPVVIPAHQSASVPLRVGFPLSPGGQCRVGAVHRAGSGSGSSVTSVPVARRTLIPSSGGSLRMVITSTVGRNQGGQAVGQGNTYDINVPAGTSQLTATFRTADVSADNTIAYYLVSPSGAVAASATTPNATGTSPGTVTLTTANPAAGTWEIDVVLGLTVSGKEFTQTVYGTATVSGG